MLVHKLAIIFCPIMDRTPEPSFPRGGVMQQDQGTSKNNCVTSRKKSLHGRKQATKCSLNKDGGVSFMHSKYSGTIYTVKLINIQVKRFSH